LDLSKLKLEVANFKII